MSKIHSSSIGVSVFLILVSLIGCHTIQQPDEYYCHLLAGEPTQTSIVLQARLHKSDTLINNHIPGIEGYIKFFITRDTDSKSFMESPFFPASDKTDFIAKYEYTGLMPGQKYFYRISYGKDSSNVTSSAWNSFKTLCPSNSDKSTSFVVVTGMNFNDFSSGNAGGNIPKASPEELKSGFPAFHVISSFHPDFWIGNGDNVYYDKSPESPATNPKDMRMHWHRLFSMADFNAMLSHTATFWMMDDHDYRFNDCDTSMNDALGNPLLPGTKIAEEVFREQVPLDAEKAKSKLSYRTHRLNKDVQIWMLEGRLFRSANSLPDGPGKSILGKEQLSWLKKTLVESNAPFKLIISPTPLIGPDEAYKKDNHANLGGFRSERDSLFFWLITHGFRNNGLYFICGDRHWQYHSIDPSGFEEFSCGALVDANARLGRIPGDSLSTDPDGTIIQPFVQKEASGGFLLVNSGRDEYNSPLLLFRFYDDEKNLLYAVKKY